MSPKLPDLSEVLDHYDVQHNASKQGNQAVRCPVHEDSHASASVNLGKQLWNCHACGNGGSSVDLIMLREGIDYKAAVTLGAKFTSRSNGEIRGGDRGSRSVSPGSGYRPRYFRELPPGVRRRPDYGS